MARVGERRQHEHEQERHWRHVGTSNTLSASRASPSPEAGPLEPLGRIRPALTLRSSLGAGACGLGLAPRLRTLLLLRLHRGSSLLRGLRLSRARRGAGRRGRARRCPRGASGSARRCRLARMTTKGPGGWDRGELRPRPENAREGHHATATTAIVRCFLRSVTYCCLLKIFLFYAFLMPQSLLLLQSVESIIIACFTFKGCIFWSFVRA